MTHGTTPQEQCCMARATILASVILLLFFFTGTALLDWFGITISAFKIAGGLLLFLLSIDMFFARHSGLRSRTYAEQYEANQKQDVSAFPLLAGPGTITTILLMTSENTRHLFDWDVLLVLILVVFTALIALLYAPVLNRSLGEAGS